MEFGDEDLAQDAVQQAVLAAKLAREAMKKVDESLALARKEIKPKGKAIDQS